MKRKNWIDSTRNTTQKVSTIGYDNLTNVWCLFLTDENICHYFRKTFRPMKSYFLKTIATFLWSNIRRMYINFILVMGIHFNRERGSFLYLSVYLYLQKYISWFLHQIKKHKTHILCDNTYIVLFVVYSARKTVHQWIVNALFSLALNRCINIWCI